MTETLIAPTQTSFVDQTEFGIIDQHSVRLEFEKYAKLNRSSKEKILFGMKSKHGLDSMNLFDIFSEEDAFKPEQFIDFRQAIEHYQDLEKYPPA